MFECVRARMGKLLTAYAAGLTLVVLYMTLRGCDEDAAERCRARLASCKDDILASDEGTPSPAAAVAGPHAETLSLIALHTHCTCTARPWLMPPDCQGPG